jgi:hypothetical protein
MAQRKTAGRARTARRAAQRASQKLAEQRERLWSLAPGASSQHPIEVESASVVEPRASALTCPRCEITFRIEAHRAPSVDGMRLREVEVVCPRCGQRRSIWFRLVGPSLN